MFTHSKTNSNKSTHHARQPFFSKSIARQGRGLFFSQISTPSVIQKKCEACEEKDKQIQRKTNETFLQKQNLEEEGELQTKLSIGQPDDQYEREADAVADRVVSSSDTDIQRQENPEEEEEAVQAKALQGESRLSIQRQSEEENEEEETLQTKAESDHPRITPFIMRQGEGTASGSSPVERGLQLTRGGGHSLAPPVRRSMEHAIGADFKGVRLHTNGLADTLNRSLNARAFTTGKDIYFKNGEYQPKTREGKRLLAHELTHVVQQSGNKESGKRIQRWRLGAAPAPAGWSVVTNLRHRRRLNLAENIVRGVLASRNCRNYFRDNCTNGAGANALRQAFNNARIYLRSTDDNVFGEQSGTSSNIAFNLRAFRIGHFMMASTLLHEMFHTCDPTFDAQDELDAENAVEMCRIHTPWVDSVTPRRAPVSARVTIRGWGFGPTPGSTDEVRIGGVRATIVSWAFMTDASSRVEIIAEVPAGAGAGGIRVINNRVRSNIASFTVV